MQNHYQCPTCSEKLSLEKDSFCCAGCQSDFFIKDGIAFLLDEKQLGWADKELRDKFYDGLLGRFYQRLMPLLSLPARPFSISKMDWFIFSLTWGLIIISSASVLGFIFFGVGQISWCIAGFIFWTILFLFFKKHTHFFHLIWTAIPAKISLDRNKYRYTKSFGEIHAEVQNQLKKSNRKIKLLDVSTGTGNSLLRHGWTKLDADLVGFDLSETMLRQLQDAAKEQQLPIDLVIGDATRLPFQDEVFDVVTNYGAINGYTDIEKALSEMCRVLKPGGYGVFLDEQLYANSNWIERQYFSKVLSSHNVIHHCPSEFLPKEIGNVEVHQIYEFYYLCVFRKNKEN